MGLTHQPVTGKTVGRRHENSLEGFKVSSNQINGESEARDNQMEKYVKVVKRLAEHVKEFTVIQIPRWENRREDGLNKLAST